MFSTFSNVSHVVLVQLSSHVRVHQAKSSCPSGFGVPVDVVSCSMLNEAQNELILGK